MLKIQRCAISRQTSIYDEKEQFKNAITFVIFEFNNTVLLFYIQIFSNFPNYPSNEDNRNNVAL